MKRHCFYCWADATHWESPGAFAVCREHATPNAVLYHGAQDQPDA